MTLRDNSGREIPRPPRRLSDLDPAERRELMRNARNNNLNNQAREEIAERRWADQEKDPKEEFDAAVEAFHGYAPDLRGYPSTRIAQQVDREAREAAMSGRTVDWETKLRELADAERKRLGYPEQSERDRYEVISEMKRSRGF